MIKRCLIWIFIFFVLIFLVQVTSALGVSPALKNYNFEPGLEAEINYKVFSKEGQKLNLVVLGDLAEYVELSKNSLIGSGTFTAKMKLPNHIEIPGKHRIAVMVQEKVDKELIGGTIGTSVNIISAIDIYVPYPGKYLEAKLKAHNANVGEPINLDLEIQSRGGENVGVIPKIEIHSKEKMVDTLLFSPRIIKSQEHIELRKVLDTTGYNPGNYKAIATIDYGGLATSEADFKIGDLVIDVLNYTHQVPIGKLERFDVLIESGWNDQIDGAYAEVYFFNESYVFEKFKTTSTSLVPWEKKVIFGYFETSNFTEGIYDANITLVYYGRDQGKSTSEFVKVEFFKIKSKMFVWYLIGGGGLLIIIILIILKFVLKDGKGKKSKDKKT